ncbi:MAG: nucleotidyltransferase [Butyrivibrio sp.]|uniref:nucleotidyltransferase domain-containing protein n=1 Tax=Butyrivibrio sp. TaxID=28121 RepID=UPI0025EE6165|nr:nucleotidyltransferase [Butyrivibrio sp.]MCR5769678.1 nucleotidyltransferase [Butyrivibrio sp.]
MKFTEEKLKQMAQPLSDTENDKCLHAIKAIRDALKPLGYYSTTGDEVGIITEGSHAYSVRMKKHYSTEDIEIFVQGSYANNTCVRGESDVDIAVVRHDMFEYAFGKQFSPYVGGFEHKSDAMRFKDTVQRALNECFSSWNVHRHNKSIKVDGNSYRKQADVVPAISIRYFYDSDNDNYNSYSEGITIISDDGQVINNFPKQHIINGRKKNINTDHYYKKMVRIIKKMRYMMEDLHYGSAGKVSSFGLESLLWNVPDDLFTKYGIYRYIFDDVVDYLYQNKSYLYIYKEANGIKKLCPTSIDVGNYSKFIDDLHGFYQYDI